MEIEHQHLRDVLAACTTQTDIALRVLRLNTDLNLHVASQMYAKGLEVRGKERCFSREINVLI